MGIDEEMRDRGELYIKRALKLMTKNMLRDRYRACKMGGHYEHSNPNQEFCYICWRDYSTINEKPTFRDMRRGLRIARERLTSRLTPNKSLSQLLPNLNSRIN